jgi:hypothetical protein
MRAKHTNPESRKHIPDMLLDSGAGAARRPGMTLKWRSKRPYSTANSDIWRHRGKVSSIMVGNAASIMAGEAGEC